jgi:hypothetical protein
VGKTILYLVVPEIIALPMQGGCTGNKQRNHYANSTTFQAKAVEFAQI